MSALSTAIALLLPTGCGYLVVGYFLRDDPRSGMLEKLALGYGAGAGIVTFVMFLAGVAGVPFGAPVITAGAGAVAGFFYYLTRRDGKSPFRASRPAGPGLAGWRLYLAIIMGVWVAAKLAFVFYEGTARPIFSWDAWNHWSTAGKVFFYDRGLLLDRTSEFYFGAGYRFLGHPLLNPLLQTWTALWLGEFHEVYAKSWAIFYFFGLLGTFYFAAAREAGRLGALAGVFFLAGVPLLTYHGTTAYSDLPLAYYGLAGTAAFWGYLRGGNRDLLALAGLFVSMGALTKNEGLFFFIAIGAALAVHLASEKKPVVAGLAAFLIPCVILMGPWMAFKAVNGLGFGHSGGEAGIALLSDPKYPEAHGVHWQVLPVIARDFFLRANYNLIFPFWIALTLWRRKDVLGSPVRYLYVIVLSVISMFLVVYLLVEFSAVTEATGLQRNTMTYLPVLFFTVLVLLARGRTPSSGE